MINPTPNLRMKRGICQISNYPLSSNALSMLSKKNNLLRLTCMSQRNIIIKGKDTKLHNCSYVIAISSYWHRQEYTRDSNTICPSQGSPEDNNQEQKDIKLQYCILSKKTENIFSFLNPRPSSKCDLIVIP